METATCGSRGSSSSPAGDPDRRPPGGVWTCSDRDIGPMVAEGLPYAPEYPEVVLEHQGGRPRYEDCGKWEGLLGTVTEIAGARCGSGSLSNAGESGALWVGQSVNEFGWSGLAGTLLRLREYVRQGATRSSTRTLDGGWAILWQRPKPFVRAKERVLA